MQGSQTTDSSKPSWCPSAFPNNVVQKESVMQNGGTAAATAQGQHDSAPVEG